MQERVLEILGYLLRFVQQEEAGRMPEGVMGWLRDFGYTSAEISQALSMFYRKFQDQMERTTGSVRTGRTSPYRLMNAIEREVLTTESFGYLLQLYHLGIVDINEFERIMERAVMLGTADISRKEIESIAASVIFFEKSGRAYTVLPDTPYQTVH